MYVVLFETRVSFLFVWLVEDVIGRLTHHNVQVWCNVLRCEHFFLRGNLVGECAHLITSIHMNS